jgi:hypothetical protein
MSFDGKKGFRKHGTPVPVNPPPEDDANDVPVDDRDTEN